MCNHSNNTYEYENSYYNEGENDDKSSTYENYGFGKMIWSMIKTIMLFLLLSLIFGEEGIFYSSFIIGPIYGIVKYCVKN